MGFSEEYKRLDRLCRDVMGDNCGVSAYVDEMENTSRGAFYVHGWATDFKQLKHYRWVRNQIAHTPGCTEENMCNDDDTQWVIDFYARIMNQTDPLALYRKATQPRQEKSVKVPERQNVQEKTHKHYQTKTKRLGCLISLLIVIAVILVVRWLL